MAKKTFLAIRTVLTLSAALLGFSFAKLDTQRRSICDDVPCLILNERITTIQSHIAQSANHVRYLAIGDSIIQMADLPTICGRIPINAGIWGATSGTFLQLARQLSLQSSPDFIVLELGTNDGNAGRQDTFGENLSTILRDLKAWPLLLVSIPVTPAARNADQINAVLARQGTLLAPPLHNPKTVSDELHLTASSYILWRQNLIETAAPLCDQISLDRSTTTQNSEVKSPK
ncbi:SGNH/GDSL hydrolase family protein [Hyphomicrobium sp. 2TAF46]|uniref:SGNH/GDSL hydrolase family protein n=1 Tax=Hyphomicrobium sp. 2TAF46 TaxID=3233019 RepID=UPI003F935B75